MTKFPRTVPKLTFLVPLLAALAAPTYASIAYTSCSSGCTTTSGTYSSWQSATGSAGLTFSTSPNTFTAGNLSSGVYLDPTGIVFTGYSGVSSIDTGMAVSGGSLLQSISGAGTGIQLDLPANTYAFAAEITAFNGALSTYAGPGTHGAPNTNFNVYIPSGGTVEFFAIISDTPIASIFIGPLGSGGRLQLNDFEIGQESPTPELSSVSLIGSGLVLLGFLRRRVHKPNSPVA